MLIGHSCLLVCLLIQIRPHHWPQGVCQAVGQQSISFTGCLKQRPLWLGKPESKVFDLFPDFLEKGRIKWVLKRVCISYLGLQLEEGSCIRRWMWLELMAPPEHGIKWSWYKRLGGERWSVLRILVFILKTKGNHSYVVNSEILCHICI